MSRVRHYGLTILTTVTAFALAMLVYLPPRLALAEAVEVTATAATSDPIEFVRLLHEAVIARHFWLTAGVLLMLVTYGVRYAAARLPSKLTSWALTDAGGFLLTTVLSVVGGLVHTAAAGKPVGLAVVLTMVETLLSAVGTYTVLRKGAGVKLPMPASSASLAPPDTAL